MVVSAAERLRQAIGAVSQLTCARPCASQHPCRILLGYPKLDEGEKEEMDAAQVTQAGAGEAMEVQQEAGEAKATRQGARGAATTHIRARITHVGSEYRKAVTSGTCELCITDWSARIRDISFELTDVNTGATWQTTTPTLHVGRWNDIWEVRVNPFHLSKALAHVTLVVDTDRLNDEGGRALIAIGILEAVEACGRASEMVERLDGAYICDNDWDEEQFILEP